MLSCTWPPECPRHRYAQSAGISNRAHADARDPCPAGCAGSEPPRAGAKTRQLHHVQRQPEPLHLLALTQQVVQAPVVRIAGGIGTDVFHAELRPDTIIVVVTRFYLSSEMHAASPPPMSTGISARQRRCPRAESVIPRPKDLNLERIAFGGVVRMGGAAIAAGARRKRRQQIDFGEELDEITWSDRARFHEVLVCVTLISSAHENVHHVVDVHLGSSKGILRSAASARVRFEWQQW